MKKLILSSLLLFNLNSLHALEAESIEKALKDIVEGNLTRKEVAEKYQVSAETLSQWIRNYNEGIYIFAVNNAERLDR